ncbi:hypothetical protein [Falsihalocynthiibacter sp. CO-5D18]|uniref:hypothetical protein n=1 Tax=Falsihalocynthiibacter sp. CO-5D18 TaxID=3240872 RepID=UPI00350FA7D8
MTDFSADPRVRNLPAKHAQILITKLQDAEAALVWDQLSAEIEEGQQSRKVLPEVLKQMQTLERTLERPIHVQASLPKPLVVAKPQIKMAASRRLAAAVVCEMMRLSDQTPAEQTLARLLPENEHAMSRRKIAAFHKDATLPASTTAAGFAAELASSATNQMFESLRETSAAAQFRDLAVALDFSGLASVTIPRRANDDTGSLRPAFVAEGATIPVSMANLVSTTLSRFKLGIIALCSEELVRVSNILDVIESFILADLSEGLDSSMFDPAALAQAGVAPNSLTNGAATTASAGNTLDQILTDFAYLRSKMSTARRPAVLMHSHQLRALEMLQVDGRFPLEARIATGNLWGMKIITSPYLPYLNVVAIDAAAAYIASDAPQIAVRDSVTIAMASATGAAPKMSASSINDNAVDAAGSINISDAATTVPATVVRSTFQTSSLATRIVMPVSWAMVDPDAVAYVSSVQWGGMNAPALIKRRTK